MPERTCSIEGCDKPHFGRGWCSTHYQRWKRLGDPLAEVGHYTPRDPQAQCSIDGCENRRARRDWCKKHYYRWRRHGDPNYDPATPTGEDSPFWKGRFVGYLAAHYRVRTYRGKATEHTCVDCGGQAHEWAYDHRDPDEIVADSGYHKGMPYSPDPSHYQPMCKTCHKRFDRTMAGE